MDCLVENHLAAGPDGVSSQNESEGSDDEEMQIIRRKKSKLHTTFQSSDESEKSDDESVKKPSKIFRSSDDSIKSDEEVPKKNSGQQERIKQKRNKIREKFSNLVSSRIKEGRGENEMDHLSSKDTFKESSNLEKSTQKSIEHRMDPSLYDRSSSSSEGSDQEDDISKIKMKYQEKPKSRPKSTKLINMEPKPMSTKQAMENMQKIRSESNRMLREKEVSLPYHRPRALSLRDIMSRRKPATTHNGKNLPLKMNDEQLKQYATMLEERQKEMIELCKSESEEEPTELEADTNTENEKKSYDESHEKQLLNDDIEDRGNNIEKEDTNAENIVKCDDVNDINKIESVVNTVNSNININEDNTNKVNNKNENDNKINENNSNENVNKINNYDKNEENNSNENNNTNEHSKKNEDESQLLLLHYTENTEDLANADNIESDSLINRELHNNDVKAVDDSNEMELVFSEDDDNDETEMEKIDDMIECFETEHNNPIVNIPAITPKLSGGPGMEIELDGVDTRKLSGVQLLKERYTFMATHKTPEEIEREQEKRIKPLNQHQKLKLELEDKIAEQRSLEWKKRLEEEKVRQTELKEIRGETDSEDELDKMEDKLQQIEDFDIKEAIENDEKDQDDELIENDVDLSEKERNFNPLVDDEAEESDDYCDDEQVNDDDSNGDSDGSSTDTSDDGDEEVNVKRGRILKAFEDSDDEEIVNSNSNVEEKVDEEIPKGPAILSLDEDLPSAQFNHSISEELFTSQDTTQTVSVVCSARNRAVQQALTSGTLDVDKMISNADNVGDHTEAMGISESQADDVQFDDIVGMCTGSFSQNLVQSDDLKSQKCTSELSHTENSEPIGSEVLQLCTGNFYDNEFIDRQETPSQETEPEKPIENDKTTTKENLLLKSILDELDDPQFDRPKKNKYFPAGDDTVDIGTRKRCVIESDDDGDTEVGDSKRMKKVKKKRREKRALQISDDEDEEETEDREETDEEGSDIGDIVGGEEREVEYDSEENEVQHIGITLKKRTRQFFEEEAELSSEGEWAGSGDEDEAGLDVMDREAGDRDSFHQGELARELGRVHMREVLEQDKREVRMIQELLLEDGDLGGGHRQRKYRWKNLDGDMENGSASEPGESQLEEAESEELWRRERHERETFLRKQQQLSEEVESPNVSINRTTIIKANLASKTMSNLLLELNSSRVESTEVVLEAEKKIASKDVPSPVKKPFHMLQSKYLGSVLSRGPSALLRLSRLAAPLADQNTARGPSSRGNFIFKSPGETKVTKRKIEDPGTPGLLKRLRTADKKETRRSLLDHINL